MNKISSMMKSVKIITAIIFLTACSSSSKAEGEKANSSTFSGTNSAESKQTNDNPIVETKQEKPKLPEANIELPTISYNKAKLPSVMELDQMLVDEANFRAAYEVMVEEFDAFKEKATNYSSFETPEETTAYIKNKMVAANRFQNYVEYVAQKSIDKFSAKYENDSGFTTKYRRTYTAAKTEITGVHSDKPKIIEDPDKRREVEYKFIEVYKSSLYPKMVKMKNLLEKGREMRKDVAMEAVRTAKREMRAIESGDIGSVDHTMKIAIDRLQMVLPLVSKEEDKKNILSTIETAKGYMGQ